VVTVGVGWIVFKGVLAVLRKNEGTVVVGSFVGALVSVPAAAAVFVLLFEVGGTADISLSALLAAMIGWHVLIGLGEAVITALTVSAVIAVRPDLVYGARPVLAARTLETRTATSREGAAS